MKREYEFEFYGHRTVVTHDKTVGDDSDAIAITQAPCSVPLVIVNAFEFMLENGVHDLVVDGTAVRRVR
jgi:hypothetical protein